MKNSLCLCLLASMALLTTTASAGAVAPTAYLETTPITILCNFNITGITNPKDPTKAPPSLDGVLDPSSFNPSPRVTNEVGAPMIYPQGNGTQSFFVKQLLQMLVDNGTIDKKDVSDNWELTAVRNAQYTVAGAASTPYAIFLTRIEPTVVPRPAATYLSPTQNVNIYGTSIANGDGTYTPGPYLTTINTGLVLTLGQYTGNYTETYSGGILTKASGNVTCAFTLSFDSVFYDDAYSALTDTEKVTAVPGSNCNMKRHIWSLHAQGYWTFNVGSKPGPLPTVYANTTKFTGFGSWFNSFDDLNPDSAAPSFAYGGVAPLSIHMQPPRYQSRYLFPDYTP